MPYPRLRPLGGSLLTWLPVCPFPRPPQECFDNSSLFHKALKEAFESFCNKTVANTSVAELMAAFCDNLLKKVLLGPFVGAGRGK